MTDELDVVRTALASTEAGDLSALDEAISAKTAITPELAAYLGYTCDWERARRKGDESTLVSPTVTIDSDALRDSAFADLAALMVLFRDNPRAVGLLSATAFVLSGADPHGPY